MAAVVKTIVATGASSGLGFEVIRQLLSQKEVPYRFILGARDVPRTRAAFDGLAEFDRSRHDLTILPLELSDLKDTRTFARSTLEKLAADDRKLDYLFLNAAITNGTEGDTNGSGSGAGPHGSRWSEAYIVNHLSQHYLTHLLREKLVASKTRIVVVSSGAIRRVDDTSVLDQHLKAGSGIPGFDIYSETKFVQLLGAHWWRRQLAGQCWVLAVSPGLIPSTGIGRGAGVKLSMEMPDAKTIPEGAASLLRAFTTDDFPDDPDQIFLTSWGEWWSKDVFEKTLDKALQDKWCPSRDEIEREEGLL